MARRADQRPRLLRGGGPGVERSAEDLHHPAVFAVPTPVALALEFVNHLRDSPGCVLASPGAEHWTIFEGFVRRLKLTGNGIPDAWLAALAVEGGYEWVSSDAGFARFHGLRWRNPLDPVH